MSKKQNDIFPAHNHHEANQVAYGECPQCNSALQLKYVGKSSFLGCTAYPKCDYSKNLHKLEVSTLKVISDSHCPDCQSPLAVKKGRYGMFIGCTNFPECHYISTSNSQAKPTDSEYAPINCPSCSNGKLQKRQNRFGKFFYACDNYPKCKYLLNLQPLAKTCPECKSPIMLIKNKGETVYICAQNNCGHVVDESN